MRQVTAHSLQVRARWEELPGEASPADKGRGPGAGVAAQWELSWLPRLDLQRQLCRQIRTQYLYQVHLELDPYMVPALKARRENMSPVSVFTHFVGE